MTQKVQGWSQPSAILMYAEDLGVVEKPWSGFVVEIGGQKVRCALPVVAAEAALLFAVVAFGSVLRTVLDWGWLRSRGLVGAGSRFLTGTGLSHLNAGEDIEGRDGCGRGGGRETSSFKNGFEFAGADYGVDFRDALQDFVAVALDQASGNDQFAGRAGGFEAGHLEDGVDGLLLGGVDKAAGIDDEDLGFFGMGGEARAGAVEQAHHDLGVDEVFGAA